MREEGWERGMDGKENVRRENKQEQRKRNRRGEGGGYGERKEKVNRGKGS